MEKKIKHKFVFSGVTNVDVTSDATSAAIVLPENYIWSITPQVVVSITGSPTYTVQVSNNGTDWFDYTSDLTDAAITFSADVQGFGYQLMRIDFTSAGASDGEVEFLLWAKQIN